MNKAMQSIWDMKLIVSAYCRVSTDADDQINSLESQIKYYTDIINSCPNWTLGRVYYDEGISGTSIKKREEFTELIEDALSGKIEFILTKEVSRFARNTVDTLVYTRLLKAKGIGVFFALDNINTLDTDGEFRLTIMASIAQEESRKTSERVKWGHTRRMEAGVVFGHDLLGYSIKDGRITVKPEEAEIVRMLFDKYLEGEGTYVLARMLRNMGAKSRHSTSWAASTVAKLLRNEKYIGHLRQRKTVVTDYLTHHRKYNRDLESTVFIENNHEAIIDQDTWDKVQAELARRSNSKKLKNRQTNRYWCSGKMVCGECGKSFRRSSKTNPNVKDYRCYANSAYGRKKIVEATGQEIGCDNVALNDVALAHCIREAINFIKLNKPQLLDDCLTEIKLTQAAAEKIDTGQLETKITEISSLKSKAIDLVLRGLISDEDLKTQTRYYEAEIDKIVAQITTAKRNNNALEHQQNDIKKFTEELNKILQCDGDDTELYKEILDKFIIFSSKTLIVYLLHMPFGLKFKYKMTGKRNTYRALTLSMEVVPHYKDEPVIKSEIASNSPDTTLIAEDTDLPA